MHAWNYGRRIAEGGGGPPSVTPWSPPAVLMDLGAEEGGAWERLGFDTFTAWALRGWWAAHTERSNA